MLLKIVCEVTNPVYRISVLVRGLKNGAQWIIFNELQGVWKCGKALLRVFEMNSLSKLKLHVRRKQRNKIIEIYAY